MAVRDVRTLQAPPTNKLPELPFEAFLNVTADHQIELAERLKPLIDGNRKRARKADAETRLAPLLGCIVANAIVAMDEGSGWVHYSRDENRYQGHSIYKPEWLFSAQFIRTMDALREAGLIESQVALSGSPGVVARRSVYRSTRQLQAVWGELGISISDAVVDDEARPLIHLSTLNGAYLEYDRRQVAEQEANLRSINAFLAQHEVTLPQPYGLGMSRKAMTLHRIFNRGSWELGGRFYRGWWQEVRSAERPHILIGGEPTIERDYSGFLPRTLYHLKGIDYQADPYGAPELVEAFERAGIDWPDGRPIVKEVFFLMLNAKGLTGLHRSSAIRKLPNTIHYKDAIAALMLHNRRIHDAFFSSSSLRLMKEESDVCEAILIKGIRDQIPVLPIHDSYIVRSRDDGWLKFHMDKLYNDRFSFSPIIN